MKQYNQGFINASFQNVSEIISRKLLLVITLGTSQTIPLRSLAANFLEIFIGCLSKKNSVVFPNYSELNWSMLRNPVENSFRNSFRSYLEGTCNNSLGNTSAIDFGKSFDYTIHWKFLKHFFCDFLPKFLRHIVWEFSNAPRYFFLENRNYF